MKRSRIATLLLTPVLGFALVTAVGCGNGGPAPTPGPGPKPKENGSKAGALKGTGKYGTVKGRVTYNGDGSPEVVMAKAGKDVPPCPAEVPAEGWYLKDSSDGKGVQYALVFVRAPKGNKLPKASEEAMKPATPFLELRQPKCQFEPRVTSLHPAQDLKVFNDTPGGIAHNTKIEGSGGGFDRTLNPGAEPILISSNTFRPDDFQPYKISCTIHTGFMSGYLWKMSHPYAVVTDADGQFELKHVPVTEGGKLELVVWHEMIKDPGGFKKVADLDTKADDTITVDVAIPK